MATLTPALNEKTPQQKCKLPSLNLNPHRSDLEGNSPSCSTPRTNVSWMDNCHDIFQPDIQQEDEPDKDHILPAPCIFKLMQLITTILCIGLYSEGLNRIRNNITSQLFPYIICSIYLVITPVIVFSYVMGHKMPELIVRIFNTLGGILFLVAGAVALEGYNFFLLTYGLQMDNYEDRDYGTEIEDDNEKLNRQGTFLLASGILCLINSLLYFFDVGWSIYTTFSHL